MGGVLGLFFSLALAVIIFLLKTRKKQAAQNSDGDRRNQHNVDNYPNSAELPVTLDRNDENTEMVQMSGGRLQYPDDAEIFHPTVK